MGLSSSLSSITGNGAVEEAAGGKEPWFVIKATTHLSVLRLISCRGEGFGSDMWHIGENWQTITYSMLDNN